MRDDNTLKLKCSKCETVFVAVHLPVDVTTLAQKIADASCPSCSGSAWKSYIYTEKMD